MKEFQPSAIGNEWRRVRSRGVRSRGARRAWIRVRMSASLLVFVGGGFGVYGMRMVSNN